MIVKIKMFLNLSTASKMNKHLKHRNQNTNLVLFSYKPFSTNNTDTIVWYMHHFTNNISNMYNNK